MVPTSDKSGLAGFGGGGGGGSAATTGGGATSGGGGGRREAENSGRSRVLWRRLSGTAHSGLPRAVGAVGTARAAAVAAGAGAGRAVGPDSVAGEDSNAG